MAGRSGVTSSPTELASATGYCLAMRVQSDRLGSRLRLLCLLLPGLRQPLPPDTQGVRPAVYGRHHRADCGHSDQRSHGVPDRQRPGVGARCPGLSGDHAARAPMRVDRSRRRMRYGSTVAILSTRTVLCSPTRSSSRWRTSQDAPVPYRLFWDRCGTAEDSPARQLPDSLPTSRRSRWG